VGAAERTLGWERQQTQLRRQPGRPPAAPKTPARVQRQQAQRLWQRQPRHPTISLSRALDEKKHIAAKPSANEILTSVTQVLR
jgi:hypothetical protein